MRIPSARVTACVAIVVGGLALGALAGTAGAARLCLDPVQLPFAPDARAERLEERVTRVFEAGGFEVVRSAEVRAAIERVDAEWGEVFDPYTGRRDPERFARFLEEVGLALGASGLACDHRLVVGVTRVRASFVAGVARWDGRTVSITSAGRHVLNAIGGIVEGGWVAALSLWVGIADLDGRPFGFRSAGIEPLIRLSVTRGTDQLPEDSWLTNDAAIDEAILSALGADGSLLRDRGTPSGALPAHRIVWPGR